MSGGKLVAAPITLTFPPQIGAPTPLFDVSFNVSQAWDPGADGKRFLVNAWLGDATPPAPLTLVQHFDNELRAATEHHE